MKKRVPHPIPYQGSKRSLAEAISEYIPKNINTFYEPFAGSAAMSLYAAQHNLAKKFIIGDSLEPIIVLWKNIIETPQETADRYREIWSGQQKDNPEYFKNIRERYSRDRDPVDLLYLICRCVKNAIRFNSKGAFTQSVDKRRLGTHPDKMQASIIQSSYLLKGKVEFRVGDWMQTLIDVRRDDFVYMDPPYLGTSIGRDKRYHQQITQDGIIGGLQTLIDKNIRFILSYDGMTGGKMYGPPLPESLNLTQLMLHAGISSQATLAGRREETIESLYLSPNLPIPKKLKIYHKNNKQEDLPFIENKKTQCA
jgi:DNA adenine methylase